MDLTKVSKDLIWDRNTSITEFDVFFHHMTDVLQNCKEALNANACVENLSEAALSCLFAGFADKRLFLPSSWWVLCLQFLPFGT